MAVSVSTVMEKSLSFCYPSVTAYFAYDSEEAYTYLWDAKTVPVVRIKKKDKKCQYFLRKQVEFLKKMCIIKDEM